LIILITLGEGYNLQVWNSSLGSFLHSTRQFNTYLFNYEDCCFALKSHMEFTKIKKMSGFQTSATQEHQYIDVGTCSVITNFNSFTDTSCTCIQTIVNGQRLWLRVLCNQYDVCSRKHRPCCGIQILHPLCKFSMNLDVGIVWDHLRTREHLEHEQDSVVRADTWNSHWPTFLW
jgi:hypothetical protein